MNPKNTAVLIFARNSCRDALAKGIPGGDRLFNSLTTSTILKVRRTGLPWFHSGSADQIGDSFGERLTNAMERCFKEGVSNLIVIGNDSPALSTRDLLDAANTLEREKAILGPASDGGVYLIGLHRSAFSRREFQDLPWKETTLFDRISEDICSKLGNLPAIMEYQADLDSLGDIKNWVANVTLAGSEIIRLIRGLINRHIPTLMMLPAYPGNTYCCKSYNKGSPSRISFHNPYQ